MRNHNMNRHSLPVVTVPLFTLRRHRRNKTFTNRLIDTEDVVHAYNIYTVEYASTTEKNQRMDTRLHWVLVTLSEGSRREKAGSLCYHFRVESKNRYQQRIYNPETVS